MPLPGLFTVPTIQKLEVPNSKNQKIKKPKTNKGGYLTLEPGKDEDCGDWLDKSDDFAQEGDDQYGGPKLEVDDPCADTEMNESKIESSVGR